ncbi:MAG TPA: fibronectin type III domain-containing protein [Nitrospiria bacterium]|jgi:hypothetical protein
MKCQKLKPNPSLVTCSFLILFFSFAPIANAGEATLSWNSNNEPDLAGYKVYYGTSSGQYGTPSDVGTQTTHTLSGIPAGEYFFAVTAYDTSGNQSGFSQEVSKTILDGGGSQPVANSGTSAGGCGFLKNSNASSKKPTDFAMFLVPIGLVLRLFFNKFLQKGDFVVVRR